MSQQFDVLNHGEDEDQVGVLRTVACVVGCAPICYFTGVAGVAWGVAVYAAFH